MHVDAAREHGLVEEMFECAALPTRHRDALSVLPLIERMALNGDALLLLLLLLLHIWRAMLGDRSASPT